MKKLDFLTLNYTNTAPTAGNRLNLSLATAVNYNRGLYFEYIEIYLARIYDTVTAPFTERVISSANANVTMLNVNWITRPQSVTLDPNVQYSTNGYGLSASGQNLPNRVDLGRVYLAAGQTFDVTAQIYCPGIIATDRADIHVRVAFEFENEQNYFQQDFDLNR